MTAKIQTKSNYKNLNGQWLEVHEIKGKRVSCIVKDDEAKDGQIITDFTLSEIAEMEYNTTPSSIHPIFQQALNPFGIQ